MNLNDLKQRFANFNLQDLKQRVDNLNIKNLDDLKQLFQGKPKSNARIGLSIQDNRLLLVHMDIRDGWPYLLHARQENLNSDQDAEEALIKLVKELELEGEEVSFVLSPRDYYLHLVEAPPVEEDELRSAIRWKIKDLLDMKIEDAAIDVFRVPNDAYRGREMVYVVAAVKSRILSIIEMVKQAGLEMAVIDIPEMAMHNVVRSCVDDSNGVAFMDLRRSGSTMNISLKGELYLTRRINTQVEPEAMQSDDWPALKDRLVLEIQRSMDYFESQMRRAPINKIVIAQRQMDSRQLTNELDELLAANVSSLNLTDYIDGDESMTAEFQQLAFSALGATLRGIEKRQDADSDETDAPVEPEAA